MRRNRSTLKSKVGKKIAVDRSNFTTYLNFRDVYDHVEEVLVNESKIATRFEDPVWMDKEGNVVENENKSYGLKVALDLHRPDMVIVFDRVGFNLSQEKDGAKGG